MVAERALATVAAAGLEELAAAMEEVMVGRPAAPALQPYMYPRRQVTGKALLIVA